MIYSGGLLITTTRTKTAIPNKTIKLISNDLS